MQTASESNLGTIIGRIAGVLASGGFPTGRKAVLRRMSPGHTVPLAFYQFAFEYCPENWVYKQDDWMTIIAGMALMSPQIYNPQRGLGLALAETGYSETRLERLLSSRGDVRRILFLRAIRFLASKSSPFNWNQGAAFLLLEDKNRREDLHLRIARDFYQSQNKE